MTRNKKKVIEKSHEVNKKVNMKLHIEMLLQYLEKSELWTHIAFGPQS